MTIESSGFIGRSSRPAVRRSAPTSSRRITCENVMPRNLTVRRAVWALVAIGTAIRLVLAFTTDGQPYDIQFLRDLRAALDHAPLDVYVTGMGPGKVAHWPYGPGFFPFAWLAGA